MSDAPGTLRTVDPDTEAAKLAEARKDPPGREWGVQHPFGMVEGPKLRDTAASQVEQYNGGAWCAHCMHLGGTATPDRPHVLVYRDVTPWRAE